MRPNGMVKPRPLSLELLPTFFQAFLVRPKLPWPWYALSSGLRQSSHVLRQTQKPRQVTTLCGSSSILDWTVLEGIIGEVHYHRSISKRTSVTTADHSLEMVS